MSKSFSSALSVVWGVLLFTLFSIWFAQTTLTCLPGYVPGTAGSNRCVDDNNPSTTPEPLLYSDVSITRVGPDGTMNSLPSGTTSKIDPVPWAPSLPLFHQYDGNPWSSQNPQYFTNIDTDRTNITHAISGPPDEYGDVNANGHMVWAKNIPWYKVETYFCQYEKWMTPCNPLLPLSASNFGYNVASWTISADFCTNTDFSCAWITTNAAPDKVFVTNVILKYVPQNISSNSCGNPRAQVNFVPYTGIPAADQNSSTNAWDSITLGNKAVIPGGTFFDITDGTNPIDDGTIVSTGLQNFAVSRHNGYIEFLALGRRLTTYYGYYQGTIKFQNVQVDRVESGLTTATWADIGLEAVEGDTVTKVSDTEVSFKLAFANQGDGFRVYLKNPAPTPCTCPAGQEKKPDPKSPVCIVRARVDGVQDTTVTLTGYNHLAGNCTVAGIVPQAPQTPSPDLVVTAGQQRVGWTQSSPWTFQLDPLLTCPAGTTKTACMFTYGAGPLGEITCGCYPDTNTNTPKNLSCTIFTNPRVHDKPVHSQSGSPEQFCREQGYTHSVTNINASNFIGNLSKWNGSVWEINPNGLVIDSVSCCKLEDRPSDICVASGCAEGQYWCQSENTCKPAGQTCGAVTCNNNNTCEAGESCNCADCTNGGSDDVDKCGLSNNVQMVCTKDINNTTTAGVFSSITAQENFNIVNNKLATVLSQQGNANISAGEFGTAATELKMTQYDWKDTAGNFLFFTSFTSGEAWTKVKELLSLPTSAQVLWSTSSIKYENDSLGDNERYLYSYVIQQTSGVQKQIFFATEFLPGYGWRKIYVISKDYPLSTTTTGTEVCQNFTNPTLFWKPLALWTPSVGSSWIVPFCLEQWFRGTSTVVDTSFLTGWLTLWKSNGTGWEPNQNGDKINEIRCCGVPSGCVPFTTSTVKYTPNTDPRTQGWLNINGIGTAQNDGGKLAWQVNDGGNDGGDNAVIYKKFSSTELNDFFTLGGKYTAQIKNFTASLPTSSAGALLASYLEIARGKNTTKGERRFTFVFWLDTDKTPTIIGLSDNGTTYVTPTNSIYKYKVIGGANQYNTYEMVYDPTTDTVDLFVNGVERISNFPGNTVDPGYAAQINGTAAAIFGSGSSGGIAKTNYGDIVLSIKNTACVTPSPIQVGACCPVGAQWDSNQSKCVLPPVPWCAEGEYYCHAELKCKAAGATCGTVTCNYNNVCDTNESCDCADCNEKVDHCGLSSTGEQMICTKDTAPTCYTDKFPYCLSGCLDGYKMDTNGQCLLDASNLVPPACTVRSIDGTTTAIATCQSNEVLTGGGCTNTMGGAYFLGGFPIKQGESWTTYTPTYDPGYWHSTEYPAAPVGPIIASGNGYACATGYSATYVRASAVCCQNTSMDTTVTRTGTIGDSKSLAQCNAGEVRVGGWCRYISGGSYFVAGYPLSAGETYSGLTATQDGFVCVGGVGTMIEARAVCRPAKTGETVTVRTGPSFDTAKCNSWEIITWGGCKATSGAYFYIGTPVKAGTAWSTVDSFTCSSGSSFGSLTAYAICAPDVSDSAGGSCFTPNPSYVPAATPPALPATAKYQSTSLLADGTVNVGIAGYLSQPFPCDNCYYVGPKAGQANPITFKIPTNAWATGKGKYHAFDIINNSYFINMCFDNVNIKISFDNQVEHSLVSNRIIINSWWMRIIPDKNKQGYGWVGTKKANTYDRMNLILDKDNANYENWKYIKLPNEVKFEYQGTVTDHCPGSKGTGGGWMYYYGFIADADFDASKVANAAPPICQPQVPPQTWACCPPGSAWNSVENRCIPTTCGEGQFYCAAQKKCLAGGQTCDTAVCNNDGVCSGDESCQCGDCVNGGGDDKDKCSIVGGTQAMCSDDNLTDDKPGACCVPPKKWNTATSSCVECSNTQAPSELKAGIDQPYITCTGNGDTTKTHFKYRITKQGSTDAPFISEIFTIGTPVLHPTMTLGDYTVECFYGNATGVDTSTTATPHSCVKTMSVKSDAQGCSRVYPYKESTLSDEMISASAFDASFRCGSRKPVVGAITNPYMFRVGTQAPAYLSFDALISELFNGLTIGPVSTQTQNYNFDTGNTDVTCATKVGGGYSTNTACQLRTCVGGACNVPQTFSVVHSDDLICTTEETSTYNIGCNPAAPDGVRNQCIQWFRDAVNAGSRNVANGVEFNVSFVFNADVPTNVTCIKYVAGQMPGGLNLSDNVVCRATLKNGEKYQIYAADTNGRIDALQTTAKTVERDREAPTMAEIKYYTDETLTTEISSTQWYNKPVIALAVCSDTPLNEATSCACAQRVDTTTTDADSWSLGVPNSLIGADLMRYTRTITETLTGTQKVQVMDTAGNTSTAKNIAVSLDTQAPLVTPTESGTGATRTITLTASDTGSKIWKTTGAPSGATNTSGIIYRVGPKADMATLAFDTACNTTATYATVTETQSSSYPSQATATISNLNTATQVVAYCVRDNAGNTTRGMYPVTADACFSATNMSTIPNFDTYKWLLKTRLTTIGNDNQKYGYSFSENTADASCFRGILSTNITTLMANQLKPRTSTTLSNWDRDRAELSTSTTLSNGYYYYVYPTSNTLNIVTSPSSGAPVKSVVVEGGDIRIKTDINYNGAGKTLLLIARKNSSGQGGNIIIDTNVKNIDAILIADGGALRSSDATLPGERLTINGRVYSYNTRGGSLALSGTDFIDSATPKKFTNSSFVSASSLNDARIQDLERFRPIFADGNNACSLTVNYTAFTTANLPALLKRPNTFTGGSCGF